MPDDLQTSKIIILRKALTRFDERVNENTGLPELIEYAGEAMNKYADMLISLGRIGAKVDAAAAASFDRTSDIASTVSASASASARFVFGGNQQAPVDPARLVPVAVMRAAPPGSVAEPTAPTATNSFPASVCVCYCVAGSDVRLPPRGASWISLKG